MFYLIFVCMAMGSVFALNLYHRKQIEKRALKHESMKKERDVLLKEYQTLKDTNSELSRSVQDLIELYEITKELTKNLTLDEVVLLFREKLQDKIHLEECKFLPPKSDISSFSEDNLFPIRVDKKLTGYLAIRGLQEKDKDKFHILINQFKLVLKRVNLYAKIEELSVVDSLTGLFLRRYFQERLTEEVSRSLKFGLNFVILMLDLDHFKAYNDQYGHLVGDVLLSSVAKVIKENLRQIDIVARYGGEEFSVILPDIDIKEGVYVSSRLCKAIEKEKIRAYDEELQITVSIGASVFPKDTLDAQVLVDMADQALYQAKKTGRNRVCFYGE